MKRKRMLSSYLFDEVIEFIEAQVQETDSKNSNEWLNNHFLGLIEKQELNSLPEGQQRLKPAFDQAKQQDKANSKLLELETLKEQQPELYKACYHYESKINKPIKNIPGFQRKRNHQKILELLKRALKDKAFEKTMLGFLPAQTKLK